MRDLAVAILDRARHRVGTQLALGVLVGFVMPTIVLAVISSVWPGATGIALYIVSVAYLTTCALMMIEANLAFRKNQGLRIDHILVSEPLRAGVRACEIHKAQRKLERPSDHAPVIVDIEMA